MSPLRDRIAKAALVLGAVGLTVAPAAAALLDAVAGRTVILLNPDPPEVVDANRALWSQGELVAKIYGTPIGEPMRVLFADSARIIVPKEDPSLTLYTVDKTKGENPLQAQTLWFTVKLAMAGSALLVFAGLLHVVWKRWRRPVTE